MRNARNEINRVPISLIVALLLLAVLVAGMGWTIYAPVRQERLNRALIVAIKNNNTKQALALLVEGADPNSRDLPPQHLSLWRLLLDRLQGKRPAPSNAPTALLLACSWEEETERDTKPPDNKVLVKALLDRGAQVNVKYEEEGLRQTPLFCSTLYDRTEVSRLLIERGANVNVSMIGGTPLIWAVNNNNKVLVRLLVNRGADVNAVGDMGWSYWTPLIAAQRGGEDDPTITEILLSKGAKVNLSIKYWASTALNAAIDQDRPRTVRVLLQHGADVNIKTSDGETPLKMAKEKGNKQIIKLLKQAGAKE